MSAAATDRGAPAGGGGGGSVADRLAGAVVSARAELDVSRQVFREGPAYVVRDPTTFQAHRLSPEDYRVFAALDESRTLGETFTGLVGAGVLEEGQRDEFFAFVLQMHRLGLLSVPVNDAGSLYKRFERRRRAARRSLATSVFFCRVPMVNPDAFLTRTVWAVRWLFTRWAVLLWLAAVCAAGVVAAGRWDELSAPLLTMLTGEKLILLWVVLVGLKVVHEFGHAWACKAFGGHVPEMGVMLVVGTPCAYVDATDSWGFASRWRRVWVSLAGMYFESWVGVAAVFVWAATGPGLLNTVAYQAALLSTIVTIGFNLNPLMRFDGYYIASDLLNMPNLRARAQAKVGGLVSRWVLGVRDAGGNESRGLSAMLIVFGIASSVYKATLVLSICAMVALKFYTVGVALAAGYIAITLGGWASRVVRYVGFSEATAPVRGRAVLASVALALAAVGVVGFVPMPGGVEAGGVIGRETEHVVRAPEAGSVVGVGLRGGERARAGAVLVELENSELEGAAEVSRAELRRVEAELSVARFEAGSRALQAERRREHERARAERTAVRAASLRVGSPGAGEVIERVRLERGVFVRAGDELARVVSGAWVARVLLTGEQVRRAELAVGSRALCRPMTDVGVVLEGRVASIAPAGDRRIEHAALTSVGGGSIAVDAETGEAGRPYFEVTVELGETGELPASVRQGSTVRVRLSGDRETLGVRAWRRVTRFLNELRVE